MSGTSESGEGTTLPTSPPTPIMTPLARFMTVSVKIERNTKGYNCEVSVSDAPTGDQAVTTALETLDKLETELAKRGGVTK